MDDVPCRRRLLRSMGVSALVLSSACSHIESRRISAGEPLARTGELVYCLTQPAWIFEDAANPGKYRLHRIDVPDWNHIYGIRMGGGFVAADRLSINGISSGEVRQGPMGCAGQPPRDGDPDPNAPVTAHRIGTAEDFPGEREILGTFHNTGKRIFLVARAVTGERHD